MKKLVISLYFCTIISDYQIVVNLIAMIIKDKIQRIFVLQMTFARILMLKYLSSE